MIGGQRLFPYPFRRPIDFVAQPSKVESATNAVPIQDTGA